MKKVLIVGAGGIGSWLAFNLHHSITNNQFRDVDFTIVDNDTVDLKNIGYQNFTKLDLLDNKAEVLGNLYALKSIPKRITSTKDLEGYDCLVGAVDNSIFRKLLFNYVAKNPNVYW